MRRRGWDWVVMGTAPRLARRSNVSLIFLSWEGRFVHHYNRKMVCSLRRARSRRNAAMVVCIETSRVGKSGMIGINKGIPK
jgi:hypothetical protein